VGWTKAYALFGCTIPAIVIATASFAAQAGADRVLSQATVTERGRCSVLDIALNFPVRSTAVFPPESGDQVLIRLQPVDGSVTNALLARETLPVLRSGAPKVRSIEFEGDATSGPTLTIFFAGGVFFRVGQSSDFQHLFVAISDSRDTTCAPQPQQQAAASIPQIRVLQEDLPTSSEGDALNDARSAITRRDYETAIRLLTRMTEGAETPASAEARELLGIARERNGQLAHAKAEYEEYLRRYPTGEGATRVRQRLTALLRSALEQQTGMRSSTATSRQAGAAPPQSGAQWFLRGMISEYFYHDNMKTVIEDDFANVVIDNGFTTLQSELISALDADAGVETPGFRGRFRIAAAQRTDFLGSKNNRTNIAQMFFEGANREGTLLARIGRQYRSVGGIIGRFDGLLVGYQPWEHVRTEIISGFPVDSSRSPLFRTYRQAIGASIAYLNGPWNADVYTLRQTDHGILDRQSVGAEVRYVDAKSSFVGLLDYDVHFGEINAGIISASRTFADQTMINVGFDHRRAPILRTSNALIGQSASNLEALLATYSLDELQQLALDRTTESTSLIVSLTRPISERFSVGADATLWSLSGMPESGGVPAIPSMGTEYYYSVHLIGTSLLREGDLIAVNLGYADSYNANRYTFDINSRFPLTRNFRIGPRLFFGYRNVTDRENARLTVRPTIRLNYRFFSGVELEFEGGAEWERHSLESSSIQTWNFVTNFGLRIPF
jgi:hypothetical protein